MCTSEGQRGQKERQGREHAALNSRRGKKSFASNISFSVLRIKVFLRQFIIHAQGRREVTDHRKGRRGRGVSSKTYQEQRAKGKVLWCCLIIPSADVYTRDSLEVLSNTHVKRLNEKEGEGGGDASQGPLVQT